MDTEDDPGPEIGTTGARFGGPSRRKRNARRKAAEADTAAIPAVPVPPSPVPLPRSGARQHGAPPTPGEPVPDVAASGDPMVGLTGARFGGARKQRKPSPGPAAARPAGAPATDGPPPRPEPAPVPDEEEPITGGSAPVRPYVFTRGRTRSSFELSIETLVSAGPQVTPAGLTGEHRAVLGLCGEQRSVAELAARMRVPLGVARVLVGDLAAAGAVAVHRAPGAAGPDLALMERVLGGLRKL